VPGSSVTLSGAKLEVSGHLDTLDIAGLVTGSGGFSVTKSLVDVTVDSQLLHDASLLTVTLEDMTLKVGTNTVGVSLHADSVAIAVLAAPAPTAPATDTRSWLAIDATGISGEIHVGTVLTAALSAVKIQVNRASGAYDADGAGTASAPVNATALDWSTVPGANLTLSGSKLSVSGHVDSLDVAGLVSGSAGFSVSKTLVDVMVDSTLLHDASLLTVTLDQLALKVGTDTVGVTLAGGSIAVAVLAAPAATAPATDTRSWLAIDASDIS